MRLKRCINKCCISAQNYWICVHSSVKKRLYAHELNYQEVADVLGVPLGTIKSRVSRGRALMRTALHDFDRARVKTGS